MSRKREADPDIANEQHEAPLLLDPWGRELTPEASRMAGEWWAVRQHIDLISDEKLSDLGSEAELLLEAAYFRREYTRLAAGWRRRDHVLQPNARTYEPPMPKFVGSLPPHPPVVPALAPALYEVARTYQQLQKSLDRVRCDEGPNWPISDLIQIERLRREYHYQQYPRLWNQCGFCWEPRVPDADLIQAVENEALQESGQKLEERPPLCPEQEAVVKLAEQGENIFYTGSAGCGKSTVLHEIRRRLRAQGKVVQVVAPTGIVALAIGGTTTFSFMGWTPDNLKKPLKELCGMTAFKANGETAKDLREVDTLIIDEISMVENTFFERMDRVLRFVRGLNENDKKVPLKTVDPADLPFGGIQLIVTGDFCQLPPVDPFKHCFGCGFELEKIDADTKTCHNRNCSEDLFMLEDQYAFSSQAWRTCNFKYVHLKTIHRQQDGMFRALLEKCRAGVPFSEDEIQILMNHESNTQDALRLLPTRWEVKQKNEAAFKRLQDTPKSYLCHDGFYWNKKHVRLRDKFRMSPSGADPNHPHHRTLDELKDHRFEVHLQLKKGMAVLLLVNLDLGAGLCNGSQGVIVDFECVRSRNLMSKIHEKPKAYKRAIGGFADSFEGEDIPLPVVRFKNGVQRTIPPECQINELGNFAPYSLMWRAQIPLMAGYALTIHKAQGMTLERVIIDLDRAFQAEQVYVALSRAKTLEGLKLVGRSTTALEGLLAGNPVVRRFMEETKWMEFEDIE
ncbi:P-loop containing nucleoside triphosphate hydrolase protein [Triangularia verruculosa]|uniref:ATP-dependent DNA helicase n=1 Tax=Triangularia verruculosa TaxID=2587418 RepID=A0AAN6X5T1_9PEZI|nr:P-loop containing nucleoside triphosphate hydrolase protein [Triangularia verruculosa]